MLVTYCSEVVLPLVAHGPRIPLTLASVPSVAVALKLVKSTIAPLRVKVPVTSSVRPAAAFQLCFPNTVRPLAIVRSWVAVLRSMPDVPMVRVLARANGHQAAGIDDFDAAQLRSAPSTGLLAAVTVNSHWAMSAAPGRVSQLEARLGSALSA